jgi:hypothetical protein
MLLNHLHHQIPRNSSAFQLILLQSASSERGFVNNLLDSDVQGPLVLVGGGEAGQGDQEVLDLVKGRERGDVFIGGDSIRG